MPTKESIKKDWDFSKNMAEILEVMKQLAQSQFAASKKVCASSFGGLIVSFDPVFEALMTLPETDVFIQNDIPDIGVVVTTSDQSFMGALNSKIVKGAKAVAPHSPCMYLVTGRKGTMKFKFNNDPFVGFPAIKEGPPIAALSREMTEYVIRQFRERKLGKLYVTSAFSTSFTNQSIRATQLLPFGDLIKDMDQVRARRQRGQIVQEAESKAIGEYTARLWVYNSLFYLFQNNKPAEYAALATQMEASHDSVKKVIGKLQIAYKRARNEKIDQGMREIFVSSMVAG